MTHFKHFVILLVIPILAFSSIHKYYISVTQIDFFPKKKSVQITTRIFIDDLETLLRERYDKNITLAVKQEPTSVNLYIERYLNEKITIKINGKDVKFVFIGKEYDADLIKCYLEIEGIKKIESFEISNQVLFDLFDNQQNIIRTKINSQEKSFILMLQKKSSILNF